MTPKTANGVVLCVVVVACRSPSSPEPDPPSTSSFQVSGAEPVHDAAIEVITPEALRRFDESWSQSVAEASVPSDSPWEGARPGIELDVYLGTWCSDSVDVVGDFLGLIAVHEPNFNVRFFTLPEERTRWPHDHRDLRYVPSFIVRQNGAEWGRVVESAPAGIAEELHGLVTGRKRGVVSGRLELNDKHLRLSKSSRSDK